MKIIAGLVGTFLLLKTALGQNCNFTLQIYENPNSACENIFIPPSSISTIIADGTCQYDPSAEGPGYYIARCIGGTLVFTSSGCESAKCQACPTAAVSVAAGYANLYPEGFSGITPTISLTNSTCNELVNAAGKSITQFFFFGSCSACVPPTTAPSVAPTTLAPRTLAPTTQKPTTVAPTTIAPTTFEPTTIPPATIAPAITSPISSVPVTTAPFTGLNFFPFDISTPSSPSSTPPALAPPVSAIPPSPGTLKPLTLSPATIAPISKAPETASPVTASPVTASPVTASPVTSAPITAAPVTSAPVTQIPSTGTMVPITVAPVTVAPVTSPPGGTCLAQVNMEQCPSLLLQTAEICECYAFCNGQFSHCFPFESIFSSRGCRGVIVAGCSRGPLEEGVTASPTAMDSFSEDNSSALELLSKRGVIVSGLCTFLVTWTGML